MPIKVGRLAGNVVCEFWYSVSLIPEFDLY